MKPKFAAEPFVTVADGSSEFRPKENGDTKYHATVGRAPTQSKLWEFAGRIAADSSLPPRQADQVLNAG